MRGEIIYKILDYLEDKRIDAFNFFNAFISAGYGATFGKIDREYRLRNNRSHISNGSTEKAKPAEIYF